MNKYILGALFIAVGLAYGSLAFDGAYDKTLGYLVKKEWLKQPEADKITKGLLGRKMTILMYSIVLIAIGLFIIWSPNN